MRIKNIYYKCAGPLKIIYAFINNKYKIPLQKMKNKKKYV